MKRIAFSLLIATSISCTLGKQISCGPAEGEASDHSSAFGEVDDALDRAFAHVRFKKGTADENVSDAAVLTSGGIVLVSDEGQELALVDTERERASVIDLGTLTPELEDLLAGSEELDLEGAAALDTRVFVVGSASLKRTKVKPGKDNASRLTKVVEASGETGVGSRYLFELEPIGASQDATFKVVRTLDVRKLLLELPVLAPFGDIPSKDNGIDVEGLAVDATHLYLGLRGPVLRGHALVVRTAHDGSAPEVFFLYMDGLGIRALSPDPRGGFFVLAGPTMEVSTSYVLYSWDGTSSVCEGEASLGLRRLTEIPQSRDRSPEGIFLNDRGGRPMLCVIYDGPKHGAPRCAALAGLRK